MKKLKGKLPGGSELVLEDGEPVLLLPVRVLRVARQLIDGVQRDLTGWPARRKYDSCHKFFNTFHRLFSSFLWSNPQFFRCPIRRIKQKTSFVDTNPDSMVSLDPYQDPDSQSGSGSRRAKNTEKHRKKLIQFHFWKCLMFFFDGWRLLL